MVRVVVFGVDLSDLEADAARQALRSGGVTEDTLIYLVDLKKDIHLLGKLMRFHHKDLLATARIHKFGLARRGITRILTLRTYAEIGKFTRDLEANRGIIGVPIGLLGDCERELKIKCGDAGLRVPVRDDSFLNEHFEYVLTKNIEDRIKLYDLFEQQCRETSVNLRARLDADVERRLADADEQEILARHFAEREEAQARLEEEEEEARLQREARIEEARARREAVRVEHEVYQMAALSEQMEHEIARAQHEAAVAAAQYELGALERAGAAAVAQGRLYIEGCMLESLGLNGPDAQSRNARLWLQTLLHGLIRTWTDTEHTEHPNSHSVDTIQWILGFFVQELTARLTSLEEQE